MQTLYFLAHAGEEHATDAEALAHSSTTTAIVLFSAATLIALALAMKYLSNKKDNPPKPSPNKK